MNSKSRSLSFRALVATVALVLSMPSRAMGFVREASNWDPRSLPISYRVNTSSAPSSLGGATAQAAVDAAFASWAAPSCTSWSTINRGTTTSVASSSDGQNTVLWVSGSWPAALGDPSTTIGVTTTVWRTGGYFTDADIQFNNVRFTWSTTGTGGTVDTQSIAAHEEGHFLGLGHSTRAAAIMYPTYSGGLKRTLDGDDVNGVCAIYPYVGPMRDAGVVDVTDVVDVVAMPDVFDAGAMMDVRPPALLGEDCSTQICDVGLTCLCSPGGRCVCGSSCSASMPCPTGYSCAPTSGGSYCVRGGNTGDPCASSIDCNSGLCVNTGASSICSQACTDDCTCPAGYTCYPTTSGQTVCVPGTRACGPGPDAGMMDTGPVIDVHDVGVDVTYVGVGENCSANPCSPGLDCLCALTPYCVCAVECRSAPCEAPFSCQDTTAGPFCLPPGGGGASCSSGLDCITGLCMTTATGGACAPPCRDDCDCANGQQCYPSVNPGVNVCNIGDNQCGVVVDAGPPADVGMPMDVGSPTDVVAPMDVASGADAGMPMDVIVAPNVAAMDTGSAEDIVVTGPDVVIVDAMGSDATALDVATDATSTTDAGDVLVTADVADAIVRDGVATDSPRGSEAHDAAGDGGSGIRPAGCACRVPAHGATDSRAAWWMALFAVVSVVRRRRRAAR